MRKIREVLRLRFERKLGYQQIGQSCSIGVSTVHKYLKRAEAAGVKWALPEDWDESRVEAAVFPRSGFTQPRIEPRQERHRSSPRFTSSCAPTSTSPCNCCGKNTGRLIPMATVTRDSAILYPRGSPESGHLWSPKIRPTKSASFRRVSTPG